MKLYRGYYPKNVNSYWIVTYDIPMKHPIHNTYVGYISTENKLLATLSNFKLFPELYAQVPIGISNETT